MNRRYPCTRRSRLLLLPRCTLRRGLLRTGGLSIERVKRRPTATAAAARARRAAATAMACAVLSSSCSKIDHSR